MKTTKKPNPFMKKGMPPFMEQKGAKKPAKKFASGGSVSSRADGVATKGKTHTTMVKMAGGGKC